MATESRADREQRPRDHSRNVLLSQGVQPESVRWHVQQPEQCTRAFPARRLPELEPDKVANNVAVRSPLDAGRWGCAGRLHG